MKQVQFNAFGTPHEVAACVEAPDVGAPGPEEVVIEVLAFPINPADLLTMTGGYAIRPPLPATLGAECVGRIAAIGAGVRHLAVGDRVINLGRDNWCQRRKVPAAQALKVPGDADVLQLAMLKVNPATALLMLLFKFDTSFAKYIGAGGIAGRSSEAVKFYLYFFVFAYLAIFERRIRDLEAFMELEMHKVSYRYNLP